MTGAVLTIIVQKISTLENNVWKRTGYVESPISRHTTLSSELIKATVYKSGQYPRINYIPCNNNWKLGKKKTCATAQSPSMDLTRHSQEFCDENAKQCREKSDPNRWRWHFPNGSIDSRLWKKSPARDRAEEDMCVSHRLIRSAWWNWEGAGTAEKKVEEQLFSATKPGPWSICCDAGPTRRNETEPSPEPSHTPSPDLQ